MNLRTLKEKLSTHCIEVVFTGWVAASIAADGLFGYYFHTRPDYFDYKDESMEYMKAVATEQDNLRFVLDGNYGGLEGTLIPEERSCHTEEHNYFSGYYRAVVSDEDRQKVPSPAWSADGYVPVNAFACELKFRGLPEKVVDDTWYFSDECLALLRTNDLDVRKIEVECSRDNKKFAERMREFDLAKETGSLVQVSARAPVGAKYLAGRVAQTDK